MKLPAWIFALALHLYPPRFRGEFGEEMQAVFCEALQNASRRGPFSAARILWREISDLPANLLRQIWRDFCAWLALPWPDPALSGGRAQRRPWLSAGLAALPHLLYALALYLPLLLTLLLGLPAYHGPGLPMFWATVAVMLALARRMGWPAWSGSWLGYGLVGLLHIVSDWFPARELAFAASFAWLCLAAILLFWLARRDWLAGLLAILPISPMWIWLARLEGLPGSLEEAALFLSAGMMLSIAVAAIVRLGRWQSALLILLAVILTAGGQLPSESLPSATGSEGWLANYTSILALTAPLWLLALARRLASLQPAGRLPPAGA